MNPRLTERIDVLRAAIGLFVVLGVVLTAVAGYAMLRVSGGSLALSPGVAVSVLSGVSLVVFAVVLTKWLHRGGNRRTPRRSA